MGSGCYSYSAAKLKADTVRTEYCAFAAVHGDFAARAQTFTKRELDQEMNIRDKVRECRDTEEHPCTVPVIIALDVTGSMGHVPQYLIQEAFPEIMKRIQEEGINDVQVCFMGIGDHHYDDAPIQVGQFESSDDLMEKWLTKLYLEGGGGGNDGESYLLAWYAALRHTDCDAIKKGRGGILITIGDEPNLRSIDAANISKLFGGGQADVIAKDLYKEVTDMGWDTYHINVMDYTGSRTRTIQPWKDVMGDHLVCTQHREGKDIIELIAGIVTASVRKTPIQQAPTAPTDSPDPSTFDIL